MVNSTIVALIEWLGYGASAVVAVSLMMSSLTRLRWFNLAGALLLAIYGYFISSMPVLFLNLFIVATNIYYLINLYRTRVHLKVIECEASSHYLHYFLDYNTQDILSFFPEFNFSINDQDRIYLLIRDTVVAGVLILTPEDTRLRVRLDYVTVDYRDLKLARYLYYDFSETFLKEGYNAFVFTLPDTIHERYLRKIGFFKEKIDGNHYILPLDHAPLMRKHANYAKV